MLTSELLLRTGRPPVLRRWVGEVAVSWNLSGDRRLTFGIVSYYQADIAI